MPSNSHGRKAPSRLAIAHNFALGVAVATGITAQGVMENPYGKMDRNIELSPTA